ncbi:hypothetical protein HanPI659440_Chr12g0474811 [Helianthus annuus]|nr:hypothetical protein HanPI659440_Chr12g0474811 [Helianthus annuus]
MLCFLYGAPSFHPWASLWTDKLVKKHSWRYVLVASLNHSVAFVIVSIAHLFQRANSYVTYNILY